MNELVLGHVLADANCVIRYVDPIFCELTAFRPEDAIGRHLSDITHPDDWKGSKEAIEALLAYDRPFRLEKRYVRADGKAVTVRIHASLFREAGAPPQMIAATELITPGVRAPRTDQDSDRTIHDALDRLADVVMTRQ